MLSAPSSSMTVHFGRMPPSDVPAPAQIRKVRCRLFVRLDSTRRAQQMPKLDEWRSGPASFFLRALEHALFVAKTKRADTAEIIHGQQIIKRVERLRLSSFPSRRNSCLRLM